MYVVSRLGGVLRTNEYFPYTSQKRSCRWRRGELPYPVPVIGYRRVPANENAMAEYVYRYGALSAAINSASMAVYKGNIDEPTDEQCDPHYTNHAVLIVGYNIYVGNRRVVPYWVIKNSWGRGWGDKGFYYLVRGRNACGISSDVFVN